MFKKRTNGKIVSEDEFHTQGNSAKAGKKFVTHHPSLVAPGPLNPDIKRLVVRSKQFRGACRTAE